MFPRARPHAPFTERHGESVELLELERRKKKKKKARGTNNTARRIEGEGQKVDRGKKKELGGPSRLGYTVWRASALLVVPFDARER